MLLYAYWYKSIKSTHYVCIKIESLVRLTRIKSQLINKTGLDLIYFKLTQWELVFNLFINKKHVIEPV